MKVHCVCAMGVQKKMGRVMGGMGAVVVRGWERVRGGRNCYRRYHGMNRIKTPHTPDTQSTHPFLGRQIYTHHGHDRLHATVSYIPLFGHCRIRAFAFPANAG